MISVFYITKTYLSYVENEVSFHGMKRFSSSERLKNIYIHKPCIYALAKMTPWSETHVILTHFHDKEVYDKKVI